MAGYWLKLYTEILNDPKYHRLSDTAKLGMYELLLLAKERGFDGSIPPVDDLAFYTRRTPEWWTPVLVELEQIRFLIDVDDGLKIRQFEIRQSAIPGAERARQSRVRKNAMQFTSESSTCETHADECEKNGEVEVEVDVEKDVEKDEDVDVVHNNDNSLIEFNQVFENATGLSRSNCTNKERSKWDAALDQFIKTGALPETIAKSIAVLKSKGGYVIAGPWSIVKAVQIEVANQRQTVPKEDGSKYISGPYAGFVQH